ncbi:hypothetical protein PS673_02900 [Pseudomonas fluorescens]|uniref:Uncharacterized protein n=1 Tax=Pseudomonas fluorescens TaxID=294 RepID=A0A5E6TIZ8_PSEFL|nr:hypothetical protein [Pseudomonas fluorescens]VVM93251.1 hypothetical protein PS673_02900 [Pseudomonas fluorescens]
MQTHYLIIAACSALGLLLMAYFIRNAILRAFARIAARHATELKEYRERIAALTNDIIHLSRLPQTDPMLTWADYQTLLQAQSTLILAQLTWRAMPGTESTQLKAEKQAHKILELANRISNTVEQGAVS